MNIKSILLASSLVCAFAYCSPKVSKEVVKTQQPEPAPEVTYQTIKRSSEEFEQGKVLMTQSCGRCHILFEPKDYTVKEWDKILERMIPKARLADENAALVRDYIIAHAKDYNP